MTAPPRPNQEPQTLFNTFPLKTARTRCMYSTSQQVTSHFTFFFFLLFLFVCHFFFRYFFQSARSDRHKKKSCQVQVHQPFDKREALNCSKPGEKVKSIRLILWRQFLLGAESSRLRFRKTPLKSSRRKLKRKVKNQRVRPVPSKTTNHVHPFPSSPPLASRSTR